MADGDAARRAHAVEVLHEAAAAHEATAGDCLEAIVAAANLLRRVLAAGGQVLVFGNGGSAADAQHFAAELVGRYEAGRERRARPALALSSDPSVVTALANDLGFTEVFARQVEAFGRPGDVALGLTTSGASKNVLVGLETARRLGLRTIALTGRAAGLTIPADIHVAVPAERTPRVQEVHGTLLHVLCELIEDEM
jgi:D-sedoheptulose 7-phosphate isomerase